MDDPQKEQKSEGTCPTGFLAKIRGGYLDGCLLARMLGQRGRQSSDGAEAAARLAPLARPRAYTMRRLASSGQGVGLASLGFFWNLLTDRIRKSPLFQQVFSVLSNS
ncbi:hypothetical protein [Bordetella bronchiseptica]|uniref:hypothetical protein n=1 Tax=Bordetella bronchiseptica TaxID=518 RepID=UPI000FD9E7B3|nr:hypothetical protein [Bordetella bronchiseptica]